jgi:phosphatidylcholine synthase
MSDPALTVYSRQQKLLAYAVHLYTALGLLCGALIAADIVQQNYRRAFIWMIVAVLIDATDGTFARKFRVKEVVPHIDGRKLDDIVDYLNYTFLPLVMIARADWLPSPAWLWVSIPLVASVFAFVNTGAKEECNGFFLGFPSYWNVFAFYTAVWFSEFGQGIVLAIALALSVLSVLPLRFVYPNRAPRWRTSFLAGGAAWLAVIAAILCYYPDRPIPSWLLWLSAVYPALYVVASLYLDRRLRER